MLGDTRPGPAGGSLGAMRARVCEALRRFRVGVHPDALVSTLADVDRAIVAIVRALLQTEHQANGLLVFDEPTEYLPDDSRERLFSAIRSASDSGFGVLLVTHRLDEARTISDRVTILRDGAVVHTADSATIDDAQLAEMILGRPADKFYPAEPPERLGEKRFSMRGFNSPAAHDLSFDVRGGEIVRLTGLLGAGFDEVPDALLGQVKAVGEIQIGGGEWSSTESFSARDAAASGLAVLPANRLRFAGFGEASVRENVSLPVIRRFFRVVGCAAGRRSGLSVACSTTSQSFPQTRKSSSRCSAAVTSKRR